MQATVVRSLAYTRAAGRVKIRETVGVGIWFGKTNSAGVDLYLHAEQNVHVHVQYMCMHMCMLHVRITHRMVLKLSKD